MPSQQESGISLWILRCGPRLPGPPRASVSDETAPTAPDNGGAFPPLFQSVSAPPIRHLFTDVSLAHIHSKTKLN